MYVYVLECKNNKYYVGKTDNPDNRLLQHQTGQGSEWTKKYHPIKTLLCNESNSNHDEDNLTLDYMYIKGIENVRGGRYVKLTLSKFDIKSIIASFDSVFDKCYFCHDKHPIGLCHQKPKCCCKCKCEYVGNSHNCKDGFKCNKCNVFITPSIMPQHDCNSLGYKCDKCYQYVKIVDGKGLVDVECSNCNKRYVKEHKANDTHVCKVRTCFGCGESYQGRHTCLPKCSKCNSVKTDDHICQFIDCTKCKCRHLNLVSECFAPLLDVIVYCSNEPMTIRNAIIDKKKFEYQGSQKNKDYIIKMMSLPPSQRRSL